MADAARLAEIVGHVLNEALRSSGRAGIVILDGGTPEAALLGQWCRQGIGTDRTWRASGEGSVLAQAGETLRYLARIMAAERNALTANAANKTTLLLGADWPVEPLLPLGDLYGSEVAALTGGWSGPPDVRHLVELAGGIEATDRALGAWFDGWQSPETALADLPSACRGPFLEAVRRGRFWRERAGLIPKLSARTIGIDLFA